MHEWRLTGQVWELNRCKLMTNHYGHQGYINTVTVSPDGSLCASGGKDGVTMLWELSDGKHLYSLEAGDVVNALVFSPNRYCHCFVHQDLRPREQVDCGRTQARVPRSRQERPGASVSVARVVGRRPDAVCWLQRRYCPRLLCDLN